MDGGPYVDTRFVKAVGHPLRVEILRAVQSRDATARELAKEFGVCLAVVTYHSSVLVDNDCLELLPPSERCSTAERRYRARPRAFPGHPDWRAVPRSVHDDISVDSTRIFLDRIGAAVGSRVADRGAGATLSCVEIDVDDVGAAQIDEIAGTALAQVQMVHDQCRERIRATGQKPKRRVVALASFEPAESTRGSGS